MAATSFWGALDALGHRHALLRPADAGYEAYTGDVVLTGHPDAVARPRSEAEIADLLARAHADRIPVTPAGGQTSLTGSSVATEGILLATEGMARILDIGTDPETGNAVAVAEPGIFLGQMQAALADLGWLYPPDPTSRNEARLGATVATNATGEDTLLYGPTRRWIRELRFVRADGSTGTLRRPPGHRPPEEKATAGYYDAVHPIDLLIGSEGTLAVITRITMDLVPVPAGVFSGLAFFPSTRSALEFVVAARRATTVRPRALEFMDRESLELAAENGEGIAWPAATRAAVAFKQEVRDETERERYLSAWLELVRRQLVAAGDPGLEDEVLLLESRRDRERLRTFRHRIPARLNEIVNGYRPAGGGKVGTDWWVPVQHLPGFVEHWRGRVAEAGARAVFYGHAGNGHPHVNFLPRDTGEKAAALSLALDMCREAVALGGGVAGEHGLGKLKRHLLAVQYSEERIRAMRDIKKDWDPRWILGRGNILEPEAAPE